MSRPDMEKRFDPASYEPRWQRLWAERGLFVARADSGRPPFCIMIPPPNVTGKLHLGHALQSTLQDVLTRWRRMSGFEALWLPGTDHAGIATQLMVERELATESLTRHELGRERFLERMWAWKERYHDNIRRQLESMGASCDFSRERFTLDDRLSRAVREAFVRLHERGRIYRGEYIVNWSPGLDTAISDLEVEMRSVEDRLWHLAYRIEGSDESIVVATTRPETMLGDTAVAFHPDDERYSHLAGRLVVVPVAERAIPLIADPAVERDFGTGLVKVTPAHDPADFELARRHGLPRIEVIDRHGKMTAAAGAEFEGLSVTEARERLLARLRERAVVVREEAFVHNVGFCQRSGVRIEPLVSTQWFCDVSAMAERALAAWRDGDLELVPASWGKTWEHWLANIRPWCISRQVWWGHQIPAWYDDSGRCFVARDLETAQRLAGTDRLTQDADVLDTWFSSALWPFSTLGWPEATPDLRTFYPTSVLVTGFDILFFWVARMVMTGLELTDQVPFRRVHLTGLVRDAEGQKMSKTKGNVLDPEVLIAEYGADAMRFTLAQLDAPGRDIPLDAERMAGYRAFGNKIWNATRFVLSRAESGSVRSDLDPAALALPERWILARVSQVAAEVDQQLAAFRFDLACHALYQFFWSDFCDWYIEMAKPGLEPATARPQVDDVLVTVLERALRLLHPVMPHLTEELWQRLPGRSALPTESICLAPFPLPEPAWTISSAETEALELLRELVVAVRTRRALLGLTPRTPATLTLVAPTDRDEREALDRGVPVSLLQALARVERVELVRELRSGGSSERVRGVELEIRFAALPTAPPDPARLGQELTASASAIARVRDRLASPGFAAKAPPAVVAGARRQLAELEEQRDRLVASLTEVERQLP